TDTTRRALNGVYLDVSGKGENAACMVATDGRRLCCQNTLELPIKQSAIIPASKFMLWPRLDGAAAIGLATVGDAVWFKLGLGPWEYYTRTVEGQFPTWRNVLPQVTDGVKRFTFSDPDVEALGKIFPTFPGHDLGTPYIKIAGTQGKPLVISGTGRDDATETSMELTGGSTYEGPPALIGVDRFLLLDALKVGFRSFTFEDECAPLNSFDTNGGRHVLMPTRLGSPAAARPAASRQPEVEAEEAAQAPEKSGASEPNPEPESEAEAKPNPIDKTEKGARQMPKQKQQPEQDQTALDRVLAACDEAKAKVREASAALIEMSAIVREAVKESKAQSKDLASARSALDRLKAISL
ncbi:MAG: hypothetical protein JW810_13230, partial [Sedimentisphaerales bacterium]|nr:hypothetical protein [Sedimentisphaerales bacterium]